MLIIWVDIYVYLNGLWILQGNEPRDYDIYIQVELASSTPYTQLFTKVILPAVRIAATNSWESRNPKPILCFLKTWEKLLIASILHNILDHIVMPKLIIVADTWDAEITRAQQKIPIELSSS